MASPFRNVEITCKTLRISLRQSPAKLCVFHNHPHKNVQKLHFPTHFSHFSHNFINNPPIPIITHTFPLFHKLYYYNY